MHSDVLALAGAAFGGFVGATFGALIAFVLCGLGVVTGVVVLIATGDPGFLDTVGFGAMFGPQVSFAGGVAAAAYAGRHGWLADGRDIVTPLATLRRPGVLLVGAAFGVAGSLVQDGVTAIPGFGTWTNPAALSVVVTAVAARLMFGRTGLIGRHRGGATGWARFAPNAEHVWLACQQTPRMAGTLGLFVGGFSAWASVALLAAHPQASDVIYLGFGISALSLICLAFGVEVPATHHITIVSATAVGAFAAIWSPAGPTAWALVLVGAVAGAITGFAGEGFSRLWLIRGDSHIDPPASSIWPMTLVVSLVAAVAG
ncbi:hypothetical protein GCM10022222_84580 [Amycolatopsis ultiminotia]|uniref:DUF7973 domain-containing protein n=1 Tax=Amycolatopsis ultiminotia TaxID=543629 RepID=A0ABP6YRH1_9PSEU